MTNLSQPSGDELALAISLLEHTPIGDLGSNIRPRRTWEQKKNDAAKAINAIRALLPTASVVTELKPCPFGCGTEQLGFSSRNGQPTRYTICWKCEAEGPVAENDLEAAKLWNTRADQPPPRTASVVTEAPKRIWLLDYGTPESCWCDCPDPDYEDHESVEYVRADIADQPPPHTGLTDVERATLKLLPERLLRWATQVQHGNSAMAYDLREAATAIAAMQPIPSEELVQQIITSIAGETYTSSGEGMTFTYEQVLSGVRKAVGGMAQQPEPHPIPEVHEILLASAGIEKLKAMRKMCEACRQGFYVEILDEVLALVSNRSGVEHWLTDVERVKVAFWASLTNANAGMKWLDHDSMEEMISAAWEGFEGPLRAAIAAMQQPVCADVEQAIAQILQSHMTHGWDKAARDIAALYSERPASTTGNSESETGGDITQVHADVERVIHKLVDAARMYEASCRLGGKDQEFASLKLDEARSAALLVSNRSGVEKAEAALDEIMVEYRAHGAAAIDVMFQIAKDARGSEPRERSPRYPY